jgi:hypothetical protein
MMGLLAIAVLCAVLGALVALTRALLASRREVALANERLDALERQLAEPAAVPGAPATPVVTQQEFVITHLGEDMADDVDRTPVKVSLTGPAFADAVVRETVVQTASVVHGLRRALAPETRNRIRFEMKRELKRSRKDRKAELKEALREYRARHRADVADVADVSEEGAA